MIGKNAKVTLESDDQVLEGYATMVEARYSDYSSKCSIELQLLDGYTITKKEVSESPEPVDPVKVIRTASFTLSELNVATLADLARRAGVPEWANFAVNEVPSNWPNTTQIYTINTNSTFNVASKKVTFTWEEEV